MSVVDAAVNSLLDRLRLFLQYDYRYLESVGARDSVESLHKQFQDVKLFLNDYTKYDLKDENLRGVVNSVRSAVYEAEDAVDRLLVLSLEHRPRGFFLSRVRGFNDAAANLRRADKAIRDCVDKLSQQNEVNSRPIGALNSQANWNLNQPATKEAPLVEEEDVVGFDKACHDVNELLTEGSEQLEVIHIVGMVGVGKTTLARMVFNDPEVDYEFMIKAFVYVSNNYVKRDVYLNILRSLTIIGEDVGKMTEQELGIHLRQQLQRKQYLIVLDDVWEPEVWNALKEAFPINKGRRCRVVITTQNALVAAECENSRIYSLSPLPLDASRELLCRRVFGTEECPNKELEELVGIIAEKCEGLPLSIVVIAGILLNDRHRVEWWKRVANSVMEDSSAGDATETSKVIQLTYKHLPNYLKACFLYLGVFPEDYEIPVRKLVRLWIAEGFIQPEAEGNLDLETIAEAYLDELINRNLVMVGQTRSNGKIKTCHFQNALRKFCKNVAMEEHFFRQIKKDEDPSLEEFRRVSVDNVEALGSISSNPSSCKCIRSLLSFPKDEISMGPVESSRFLKPSKLLRVLESESIKFTRLPVELSRLVLLRYLSLSLDSSVLPSWMSALRYMQTLIVRTTSPTLEIRADIWKMPEFRHLHTNASAELPSPSTKKQSSSVKSNIQTLSSISTESITKELFDQSPKLKKLSIRGTIADLFEVTGESSSLFDYLSSLAMLENLKLLNDEGEPRLRFSSLGSRNIFPPQLKALTLSNTHLDWEEMTVLGELENLEVLKLKDNAFRGSLWETESGGFRCLKHLHIGRTNLLLWEASEDDFPQLRSLKLNGCDKLKGLPLDLAEIPTLQSLELFCTNTQVAAAARKLQVLKLQEGESGLRLSIYPPEH